ncbi:rRNA maturation RNase YbeY [Chloroflexota bacterium]
MEINVWVEKEFEKYLEANWLEGVAEQVLLVEDISFTVDLGLAIVGKEKICQLNSSYLGRDQPTDVLAFSMLPREDRISFVSPPDGIQHLGEVVITYPQAVIQAEESCHSVKKEIAILIIHGLLHLLGYEHNRPELKEQMIAREAKILGHVERGIGFGS